MDILVLIGAFVVILVGAELFTNGIEWFGRKLQLAQGTQPTMQLQLQLAGIYLQRGNTDQAYAIYRQVLTAHPDRRYRLEPFGLSITGTRATA